jgi:hypothetical protein
MLCKLRRIPENLAINTGFDKLWETMNAAINMTEVQVRSLSPCKIEGTNGESASEHINDFHW